MVVYKYNPNLHVSVALTRFSSNSPKVVSDVTMSG